MFWQEETTSEQYQVPDNVLDVAFSIRCPTLPLDHAWELSEQIRQVLPWIEQEPGAGPHLIHGAESGNGWERPREGDALLHLSRRTKLTLRLPRQRLQDANALTGSVFNLAGHRMEIGEAKARRLSLTTILYARYLVADPEWDDDRFLRWAVSELKGLGIRFKKVLSGRSFELSSPHGPIATRSLMVADMPHEDAVTLQEQGVGPLRTMGCGLFIPQKTF